MGKEVVVILAAASTMLRNPVTHWGDGPQCLRADEAPSGLPRGASLRVLSTRSICSLSKDL